MYFLIFQIFLITDILFAHIKRQFSLNNGMLREYKGKPAKLVLEWTIVKPAAFASQDKSVELGDWCVLSRNLLIILYYVIIVEWVYLLLAR